jgi:putative ABC transport system permease protein
MFQSMLMATLRNLARNRLYTLVGVAGLTLGLVSSLLTALVGYQAFTMEHFIPGYEHTYQVLSGLAPAGRPAFYNTSIPGFQAGLMQQQYPEIESIARLVEDHVPLKQDQIESTEDVYWADPAIFKVLPLPTVSGSLNDALVRPDGIVLTAHLARKYFGDHDALGRTLVSGTRVLTVTAVIRDLPAPDSATSLVADAFLSGSYGQSALSLCDQHDVENAQNRALALCGPTYFRLRPGVGIDPLRARIPLLHASFPKLPDQIHVVTAFERIDRVNWFEGLNPGIHRAAAEVIAVAALILLAGCIVFINLATARATRRAKEVGIRKACGADRWTLIAQFLGESVLTAMLSAIVAVSVTELVLPWISALLDTQLQFDYWRRPGLLGSILLGVVVVGLLAGAYPALVSSAFRPRDVLKGSVWLSGTQWARQILVVTQCAILIGLTISAVVVYQQRYFGMHEALRVNTDQVLVLESPCKRSYVDALQALPGVRQAGCSAPSFLYGNEFCNCITAGGSPIAVDMTRLDLGLFALYGIRAVAGNIEPGDADSRTAALSHVVINEAALRPLGFASASAAIGQPLALKNSDGDWLGPGGDAAAAAPANEIIAVVPDFAFLAITQRVHPTVYWSTASAAGHRRPDLRNLISLKLVGQQIPGTLDAIDRLSDALGQSADAKDPAAHWPRYFLNESIQSRYASLLRAAVLCAVSAMLVVVLSGLGLLGVASAVAERRTKEVGIRKAMGASNANILVMLLKQFSMPIGWASLIAWPVSAWLLQRWLEGFPRHVSLQVWVFIGASVLALAISLATIAAQALRVARANPVAALHYQ